MMDRKNVFFINFFIVEIYSFLRIFMQLVDSKLLIVIEWIYFVFIEYLFPDLLAFIDFVTIFALRSKEL